MRNGLVAVRETTVADVVGDYEDALKGGAVITPEMRDRKVLVVLDEAVGGDAGAAVRYMRESGSERVTFYRKTGLVLERKVEERVTVARVNEKAKVKAPRKARVKKAAAVVERPVDVRPAFENDVME